MYMYAICDAVVAQTRMRLPRIPNVGERDSLISSLQQHTRNDNSQRTLLLRIPVLPAHRCQPLTAPHVARRVSIPTWSDVLFAPHSPAMVLGRNSDITPVLHAPHSACLMHPARRLRQQI
jgi:hypothetical protein